jgi:hypothetical protein
MLAEGEGGSPGGWEARWSAGDVQEVGDDGQLVEVE